MPYTEPTEFNYWVLIPTLAHLVIFITITLHALQRRRTASATLLWVFLAWIFPILGPLLYITLSIDRVSRKNIARREAEKLIEQQRKKIHAEALPHLAWNIEHRDEHINERSRRIARINAIVDNLNPEHPLLYGNQFTPLISGDQAYPQMLHAIRHAKKHIHLQSFIFNNDTVGLQFMKALEERAKTGVQVRVLYDAFGSTKAHWIGLFNRYKKIPNLQITAWKQANPLRRRFQINLRNHRKNLIIDGTTAFFGGVNIGSENQSCNGRTANRDYHFRAEGPIVNELQFSFLSDWHFMSNEPIAQLLTSTHFPLNKPIGEMSARLIDSGPSSRPGMLSEIFFNCIVIARKQILITTPYFVPTSEILTALRSAARRGVDVKLILPEKNNHKYAGLASKALYEDLLSAGVRIYLRKPPFIHAKSMIIDCKVSLIGTANLDIRSLELNYETTILIENKNLSGKIKAIIEEDIAASTELNYEKWKKRSKIDRLAENFCALLTPLL
jgi:cardiolipin synthase